MSCAVPFSVLTSLPYKLKYGSSIYAKVSATNIYGTSDVSEAANGAIILDVPSTVSISNVPAGTNANKITVQWSEPADNGGTDVLDYELYYAKPLESYQVLASSLTALEYTAEPLETGVVYSIKVRSRNAHGYSLFSTPVQILTAQIPDSVEAPTTEFD